MPVMITVPGPVLVSPPSPLIRLVKDKFPVLVPAFTVVVLLMVTVPVTRS